MITVTKLRMCSPVRLGAEHRGGHLGSAGSHCREVEHHENKQKKETNVRG